MDGIMGRFSKKSNSNGIFLLSGFKSPPTKHLKLFLYTNKTKEDSVVYSTYKLFHNHETITKLYDLKCIIISKK